MMIKPLLHGREGGTYVREILHPTRFGVNVTGKVYFDPE
jgi:hypothetical protein